MPEDSASVCGLHHGVPENLVTVHIAALKNFRDDVFAEAFVADGYKTVYRGLFKAGSENDVHSRKIGKHLAKSAGAEAAAAAEHLFALIPGIVKFEHKGKDRKQVSVYPQ